MNILGFNIGQNYRGILNLGSTINSPLSGTLQAVTDGMGNASPLQLSTTDLSVTQGGINRLLISTDITMRRNDNTLFFQYSNAPDVLELNGNTIRLNTLRGNTAIGHSVASARLHVRGDGTNPIARFENSTGAALLIGTGAMGNRIWSSNASSAILDINIGGAVLTGNWITGQGHSFQVTNVTMSQTSGTSGSLLVGNTFAAGAGSANYRPIQVEYTLNNSGAQTGTATGIFLNATETALNGMTHNLIDLQVGGVSRFRVQNNGDAFFPLNSGIVVNSGYYTKIFSSGIHNMTFQGSGGSGAFFEFRGNSGSNLYLTIRESFLDLGTTSFVRWGSTNLFPALKRNGAALEVRLADDSANAGLTAAFITAVNGTSRIATIRTSNINDDLNAVTAINIANTTANLTFYTSSLFAASGTINASARVQIDSTTQGFLPPRMTEAQRLAIAGGTPAVGLIVYQTDASDGLYVYKAGGWTLII